MRMGGAGQVGAETVSLSRMWDEPRSRMTHGRESSPGGIYGTPPLTPTPWPAT